MLWLVLALFTNIIQAFSKNTFEITRKTSKTILICLGTEFSNVLIMYPKLVEEQIITLHSTGQLFPVIILLFSVLFPSLVVIIIIIK